MIETKQISEGHKLRAGFTLVELMMVLLIAMITAAFALPTLRTTINKYQLKGATASATWAIQSTRFQAIMNNSNYQLTLSGGTGGVNPTYLIAAEPLGGSSYTNLGNSTPLSGEPVVLGATMVFQFQPNGKVTTSPVSGAPYTFTIAYAGVTETITVSTYGNVDVTP